MQLYLFWFYMFQVWIQRETKAKVKVWIQRETKAKVQVWIQRETKAKDVRVQSCKNPGMLEPTIPDKSHICRQFCPICRKFLQICRQFRHLGEIVCKYGLCLDLKGLVFRGFCRTVCVSAIRMLSGLMWTYIIIYVKLHPFTHPSICSFARLKFI